MKDIKRDRGCTDILFCLAFIVFLLITVVIGFLGLSQGNIESLYYGTDSTGNTCGSMNNNGAKVDMTESKYIVYPRLQEDMIKQIGLNPTTDFDKYKFFGICVKECPKKDTWVCTEKGKNDMKAKGESYLNTCRLLSGGGAFGAGYSYPSANSDCAGLMAECYYQNFDTLNMLFRCINQYPTGDKIEIKLCADPTNVAWNDPKCAKVVSNTTTLNSVAPNKPDLIAKQIADASAMAVRAFGDVDKAKIPIFVVGAGGSVALGVLFLVLMRYTAKFIVWFTVLGSLLTSVIVTLICYVKAGMVAASDITGGVDVTGGDPTVQAALTNASKSNQDSYLWAAYFGSFVTLVFLLVIVFLWRKISLASAIISEASKAVASMPLIILFPVNTMAVLLVTFIAWVIVMGNLYTLGTVTSSDLAPEALSIVNTTAATDSLKSYESNELKNMLMAWHVFAGLWLMNFIQGVSTMTICGAFAGWYWTVPSAEAVKSKGCCGCTHEYHPRIQKDKHPVWASFKRTCRYHLGSVAFGSLLIAIVQFARLILNYLNNKTQKLQKKNLLVKVIFCCVRCCLWCFEKCVKYITRSAYIIIATQGKSFCPACYSVFKLITKHIATIGVTSFVSTFVMILGKIVITAGCGILAYLWLENDATFASGENKLVSKILPIIFVLLLAYLIGRVFLGVYDMGIDTIMISFCIDSDENKEGQYMYPKSLANAIGKGKQTREASDAKLEKDNSKTAESSYVANDGGGESGKGGGDDDGEFL